jgi:hypothetical protein
MVGRTLLPVSLVAPRKAALTCSPATMRPELTARSTAFPRGRSQAGSACSKRRTVSRHDGRRICSARWYWHRNVAAEPNIGTGRQRVLLPTMTQVDVLAAVSYLQYAPSMQML